MEPGVPVTEDQVMSRPGPRAIDRLRSLSAQERRVFEFAELDMKVYFGKLTYADLEFVDGLKPKNNFEKSLLMLIHKAQDEEGKPIFAAGDLFYLQNEVGYHILSPVIEFMWATTASLTESAVEEHVKEITDNPTSA